MASIKTVMWKHMLYWNGLEWTGQICRIGGSKTPRKLLARKLYGSRPVRKPKDRWIDALTEDVKKQLWTARQNKLSLDWKIWERKIEKCTA
jgi:hypothetical protein